MKLLLLLISSAIIIRSVSYVVFCFNKHMYLPGTVMIIMILSSLGLIIADAL